MTRGHHDRYPRVSRWRKGYHRRQVDAFVSNVEVSLSGMTPMPTATDIRRAGFELRRGGYDTKAVDTALDELESRVLAVQRMSAGRRSRRDPTADAAVLRDELSGPYMRRFPRAAALRRGYDLDDVDDFVDRVLGAFQDEGPDGHPLAVDDVRSVVFRPRRGGYREDAVDDALDHVVEHLLLHQPQEGAVGP
jgi:DivIVA domain-containing protein